MTIRDLPEVATMACVVHHETFETRHEAYRALLAWSEKNEYRIIGPNREVYLRTGENESRQNDPSYVAEIEIPVEPAR